MIIITLLAIEAVSIYITTKCVLSLRKAIRAVHSLRKFTVPRRPKSFPISSQISKSIIAPPELKLGDIGLDNNFYCTVFLSVTCSSCLAILSFLSFNRTLFSKFPLLLCSAGSMDDIVTILGKSSYRYINNKTFTSQFDLNMVPVVYVVRENHIVEKFLINSGEELLSIFGEDIE